MSPADAPQPDRPHVRLFAPRLAGAAGRDRLLTCLGAFAGIALVGLVGALCRGRAAQLPWIVAPMGASAVLLLAVPASPMARPWPINGGDVFAAAVGLVVAHFVHDPTLAAGLAIGLMSLARSLRPPGSATSSTPRARSTVRRLRRD